MITVSKGLLKNKMLEYFRTIEMTGEEIIVTDRHKPVLKVTPLKDKKRVREAFEKYQGKAIYRASATEPETSEWGELS
jgi:antitoxin (DNA-binding transcriptional repressor) of toxin-antitoxin stability system